MNPLSVIPLSRNEFVTESLKKKSVNCKEKCKFTQGVFTSPTKWKTIKDGEGTSCHLIFDFAPPDTPGIISKNIKVTLQLFAASPNCFKPKFKRT